MSKEIIAYSKEITCPVCKKVFSYQVARESKLRMIETDGDLRVNYEPIDPIYYDVIVCTYCGYSRLSSMFSNIHAVGKQEVLKKITPSYMPYTYGDEYSASDAIHRYKLALITKRVLEEEDSEMAFLCLRLAWVYRDLYETEEEENYIRFARDGFFKAYESEDMPIFGMDLETLTYLIGELSRRLGEYEMATQMFSRVIQTKGISARLKNRTQEAIQLIRDNE